MRWLSVGGFLLLSASAQAEDLTTLEKNLQDSIGSPEAVQKNLLNPLVQGGSMKTLNNQGSFAVAGACQNAADFLEVVAFPGPTGDINTLRFKQDLDWDGVLESATTANVRISGVCANGVISCNAGTWTDCTAHEWRASNTGTPALAPTALSRLGGCYCINNSCGQSLMLRNASEVVGHLGSGIVAALSQQTPTLLISDFRAQDVMITYAGGLAERCDAPGPGSAGQAQYADQPNQLTLAAASTAPLDSMFSTLTTGAAATDTQTIRKTCTTRRTVSVDETTLEDVIRYNGGVGALKRCGPGCLQLVLGTVGDDYWQGTCGLFDESVSFWVEKPERILSATLIRAKYDDHIQVISNNQLLWAHDSAWTDISPNSYPPGTVWQGTTPYCERDTSWDLAPNVDFTPAIKSLGAHTFKLRVAVSDRGEGYAFAEIKVDESCQLAADAFSNTCDAYQNDPDCQLESETIDGITTISRFTPSGLKPLPTTRPLSGNHCQLSANRAWWEKTRVYQCKQTQTYALDDIVKRYEVVSESATATAYDDRRLDPNTNTWVSEASLSLALPTVPTIDACEKTCKTKKDIEADEVAGLGPETALRTAPTTTAFFYYTCANDACPAGPGETVVEPCQCQSFFHEATIGIQAARLSGRDAVCTSGTPSPL